MQVPTHSMGQWSVWLAGAFTLHGVQEFKYSVLWWNLQPKAALRCWPRSHILPGVAGCSSPQENWSELDWFFLGWRSPVNQYRLWDLKANLGGVSGKGFPEKAWREGLFLDIFLLFVMCWGLQPVKASTEHGQRRFVKEPCFQHLIGYWVHLKDPYFWIPFWT